MTKKDLTIFLTPLIFSLIVIGTALSISNLLNSRIHSGDSQEKLEQFSQDVQSGKRQVTTEEWLKLIGYQQAIAKEFRNADRNLRDLAFLIVGTTVIGIAFQTYAIMHVRKRVQGK